jgi:hypothetical protein
MKETRVVGGREVTFSDNPSRAGGVFIQPAWPWSEAYRKDYAASWRNPPDDQYKRERRAELYHRSPKMG